MLSKDLEHCLLYAAMSGHLPLTEVKDEELGKEGRWVAAALRYLSKRHSAPFAAKSVYVAATDVLGGDKDILRPYCLKVRDAGTGCEVADLLRSIRHKQILVKLINKSGEQLAKGELDEPALMDLIQTGRTRDDLPSLASLVKDSLPELPRGVEIKSLPVLDSVSGGLFGLWVIGGEPGVGKSTLALQLALEYARRHPVLYYDFEQGEDALLSHIGIAFNGDTERVKELTQQVYVRDSVRSLSYDIGSIKPPAMLVFDSVQSIPTSGDNRRTALDAWIGRCNAIKRRGYVVVLVSELNRANYGRADQAAYKETGELEYKADFGIQLLCAKGSSLVDVHCVKNRHRPEKGLLVTLERKRGWLFTEER